MFTLKRYVYFSLLPLPLLASHVLAEQLSPSTEVQANIAILRETKSCSQCDLSGADLNRLDLSGANLEGANLSRARMSLANLSGANLHNANLREAVFSGADLGDADLRGADLTGASLIGAYMGGALLDGEMVSVTPYAKDEISDLEETVYVEDTVHSKTPQETEEMSIAARRDFEETPPAVPIEKREQEPVKQVSPVAQVENVTLSYGDAAGNTLPEQSAAAPDSKAAPAIQEVRIEEEVAEAEAVVNEITQEKSVPEVAVLAEEQSIDDAFAEKEQSGDMAPEQPQASQEATIEPEQETEGVAALASAKTVAVVEEEVIEGDVAGEHQNDDQPGVEQGASSSEENVAEETLKPVPDELEQDEDTGVVDQAVGVVKNMLSVFSSPEPSTEMLKNIATLLDTNQCYGCALSGVDLSGENLSGADLEGADLSNAILTKVDFEGANLKGANLTGADLSGADLSEADLYSADLSGANLTDTNLEGTLLDDVNLSGVKGYNKQPMLLMEAN